MIVYQIVSTLFWLLLLPFCIGLIPAAWIEEKKRNVGLILLSGYLLSFALFWVVTVPAVMFVQYDSFLVVVVVHTVLSLGLGVWGMNLSIQKRKVGEFLCPGFSWKGKNKYTLEQKIGWIVFFTLLGFQLYKAVVMESFDGDDAYYVAQSLVTQQSNTMYLILPYTGGTTAIDLRHALAVFPMWIAYIGRMTNIHATIMAHTILPLILIPFTYLIYYEIGKSVLINKKKMLAPFMVLLALIQIFGNVSIFTSETFLLTRTWQGKSLTANFVIPIIIWLLLLLFEKQKEPLAKKWEVGLLLLLALANVTAGICSSMAVFLGGILIMVVAFWMAVFERKINILVKAGVTCIPNAIYMLLYLLLK